MSYRSILLTVLLACAGMSAFAQQKGEVIFRTGFDKGEGLQWEGGRYRLVKKDGNSALYIRSSNKVTLLLPVEKAQGAVVAVRVRVKAKNVTTPPQPWNGIKVMLHGSLPWTDEYPQLHLPAGSFDWREAEFRAPIARETDTLRLVLGLESVKGKVWFDSVQVSIAEPAQALPEASPNAVVHKGHDVPRLRGMMVPPGLTADDIETLAGWGVNHIRWQLSWNGFPASSADTASLPSYINWLNTALAHIDSLLPLCRQHGIRIALDLHSPPGGRTADLVHKMFREKQWQDALLEVWRMMATRYKDEPAIWGYDIVNEPIEGIVPDGLMNWQQLAHATAEVIRSIDTTHVIIVEGTPAGTPEAMVHLRPLPFSKMVYSFHMYHPMYFTHQGLEGSGENIRYPGIILGREWNITTVKKILQPIKNWQNAYGAHIYVGEFSAIRWAPGEGAYYYLRDCIEVFEEAGWDWAYHAFREYNGWSIEHTTNPDDHNPSPAPTLRQQLLMDWFGRNEKNNIISPNSDP